MCKRFSTGIRILLITGITIMVLGGSHAYGRDKMKVRLGDQTFDIPKANILDPGVPFWIRYLPGLEKSSGEILLSIDAKDISEGVYGYKPYDGEYKADILLRIAVLGEEDLKRVTSSSSELYSDVWFGRGAFGKKVVGIHNESGFFKVHNEGSTVFWTALKMYPDENQPLPDKPSDFWVAGCRESTSPLTANGAISQCSARTTWGNLYFDFSVAGFNLKLTDEIKMFLVDTISAWKI